MSAREPWKDTLQPFADAWKSYMDVIDVYVRECTEDELQALEDAAKRPNTTNCWFATWEAAKDVRKVINGERLRRQRAAEAAARGPRPDRAYGA